MRTLLQDKILELLRGDHESNLHARTTTAKGHTNEVKSHTNEVVSHVYNILMSTTLRRNVRDAMLLRKTTLNQSLYIHTYIQYKQYKYTHTTKSHRKPLRSSTLSLSKFSQILQFIIR
ncbi:hypothetical protein QVD17_14876 [Tagetes erecta]|uniref:Uncharacterized protein n=1 Tax=Tagetes erecta TaxID=13708 RepID=A0AAD8KTT8_TARER|nr:hypothetical protein QVD17_14876 [Tagetes erecta]